MQTRDAGMLHTTLIWETGLQSRSSRFESTTIVVERFGVHRSSSVKKSSEINRIIHIVRTFSE